MPRIRLSDRNIETSPLTRYHMPSGFREGLHGLGVATQAQLEAARQKKRNADDWQRVIATGLDAAARIKGAVERRAEQDANEVATQWEATMLAGLNGSTAEDGSHRPGIAQKTWQDYEQSGGKESPITDLAEIEKTFQSSDAYKNMTGMARDRFNRKVAVRRAQYQRAVNEMYDRNRADRTAYFDKMADKVGEDKIATTIFSDDATFEGTAREETFRKMGRKFRALMANPEVIDEPGATPDDIKWKDPRADLYFKGAMISDLRNLAMGRCAKMAENAAQGDVKWVGGKLVTNDAQLRAAEAYAAKLATPTKLADGTVVPARISPAEAQAIGFKCVQAKEILDRRIQNEISGKAANAIAGGNLKELEATEVQLLAAAKDFQKGSKNQTTALVAANKVKEAADGICSYEMMADLDNGRQLLMSDGKTPIFQPGTRQARLFPKVYAAFTDKQTKQFAKSFKAVHDQNRLVARQAMIEYAANGNPQGYLNWLTQQVIDKKLTAGDFSTLRTEFQNGWMRGFKGQDQQLPKQMQLADTMLKTIKDKLGVDYAASMKRTDAGEIKLDKFGAPEVAEKAELPDAKYTRDTGVRATHGDVFFSFSTGTVKATERFSGTEVKTLLDEALRMSMLDGAEVPFDPVTGERLPDGKTHRINAAQDFSDFIDHLKDQKKVLSAARELANRAAYANNIRSWAAANERDRTMAIAKSKPVHDSQVEKKDDKKEEE